MNDLLAEAIQILMMLIKLRNRQLRKGCKPSKLINALDNNLKTVNSIIDYKTKLK